jgi:hypothetical protein
MGIMNLEEKKKIFYSRLKKRKRKKNRQKIDSTRNSTHLPKKRRKSTLKRKK